MVVECLNHKCFRDDIDLILQDCRHFLLDFVLYHVMFVKRAENRNAHQLVGLAHSLGNQQWLSNETLCSLTRLCNWPMACNASFM